MVGMARSKKKKIEAGNSTADDAAETDCATGSAGEQQQVPARSSEQVSSEAVRTQRTAAQEKRWQAALEAWKESVKNAEVRRLLAEKYEQEEKAAKRLHDAKMNEAPGCRR